MSRLAQAHWVCTAGDLQALPVEQGHEVAFVGRSNSGKSSAINAVTGRKRLAFSSKTPGRTQTINFFGWGKDRYLVDLPGYGYAAVPGFQTQAWAVLISAYLKDRSNLRGLVVVMDARHPFTEQDQRLLAWALPFARPVLVLLSKSDKLGHHQALQTLERGRKMLAALYPRAAIQLFSATSGLGVTQARAAIIRWLTKKNPPVKGE